MEILGSTYTIPNTIPKGGLGATHDVYLRLTGKRVVDFLLVF